MFDNTFLMFNKYNELASVILRSYCSDWINVLLRYLQIAQSF